MPLSANVLDARGIRERLLAGYVNIWDGILNHPDFIGWAYDNVLSKLYIHGAPQSGKTTFSAAVAEKLLSENSDPDTVEVASIFLDPDDYFVDDLLAFGEGDVPVRIRFLQTIVQQLSSQSPACRSQPEKLEDLRAIVKTTCASAKMYVIVDGMDRCLAAFRHELEDEITHLIDCGVSLLVTNYIGLPMLDAIEYTCDGCDSDNTNHNWWCKDCTQKLCDDCTGERQCLQLGHDTRRYEEVALELTPNSNDDMFKLIDDELNLRLHQRDFDDELAEIVQEHSERIGRAICDKSKRVLVICKALLAYLRDFQLAGYEEIMHLQTRVLRPEEEVFDVLMRKIKQQSPDFVVIALSAFSLVSQVLPDSKMTFEEFYDALKALKVEKSISRQDIYALCQGMLVINSDDTVTTFHDDFSIYLLENRAEDLRHLHVNLTGLTIQSVLDLPCYRWTADTLSFLEGLIGESPLLSYAAPNWGRHLRQSTEYKKFDEKHRPIAGSLIEQALDFLQTPQKLAASLYIANIYDQEFELWPGCHELHVCAWYGLTKFIGHFTSADSSLLGVTDPVYGRTPLMIAASRGYVDFTQRMIELGADVSFESEDGRSALLEAVEHDAAQQGYYSTTRLVLEGMPVSRARTNARGTTPLIACISGGDHNMQSSQLLELLLQHPSTDVNEMTLDGQTALMKAVGDHGGEVGIIDLLLQHKDARLDVQDKTGKTALHLAAQCVDSATAIKSMLHASQCTSAVLNARDACGMTAAMLLLRNESLDGDEVIRILRKMSETGADFHCTDNNGRGLLHAAAAGEQSLAVDFLHRDQKLPLDAADVFGWGALHYASGTRAPATVTCLLQLGANSTLRDTRGWSPLDIISCDDPEEEAVQEICGLLQKSQPSSLARPSTTPSRPAWTFASADPAEFQQYCVSAADDFWLPDPKCGNLAFHCAVEENNIPLCELLLEHTDIDIVNAEGKSAMILAIERYQGHEDQEEYMEMIKFLLDRGASLRVPGSCYDAIETVRQTGMPNLALVFIERGETPLRYGPDFRQMFEEAARTNKTSVIRKLHDAQLHPLKRHDSSRLSEIVQPGYIDDEVRDLVASMEHTALERIWPACDTDTADSLSIP